MIKSLFKVGIALLVVAGVPIAIAHGVKGSIQVFSPTQPNFAAEHQAGIERDANNGNPAAKRLLESQRTLAMANYDSEQSATSAQATQVGLQAAAGAQNIRNYLVRVVSGPVVGKNDDGSERPLAGGEFVRYYPGVNHHIPKGDTRSWATISVTPHTSKDVFQVPAEFLQEVVPAPTGWQDLGPQSWTVKLQPGQVTPPKTFLCPVKGYVRIKWQPAAESGFMIRVNGKSWLPLVSGQPLPMMEDAVTVEFSRSELLSTTADGSVSIKLEEGRV
jgi:hypothetical protein